MTYEDQRGCPQCGRELGDATRTSTGAAVCPQCANSVVPPDFADRSTQFYVPHALLPSLAESRFRLSATLGEGGFGTVYRAFDVSLRRNVAIKVPKTGLIDFDSGQFIAEARAASSLRHPNVVTIFDVGFVDGAPYIVSDCIEGVSLRQWLDGPQASHDRVARVAEKLCRAIGYAHAMGVVHRDIKPSNIIVDDDGEPHVLDFGLSSSRATGDAVRLRPEVPVGTPAYMSPEQILGDVERIGKPTDVYALGVVLYQMLTRRLPFVGSASRIFEMALEDEPVRPRYLDSRIPEGLEAIALKAMRKTVEERYASADAMAQDLSRYLDGKPVRALGRHDRRSLMMTARRRFMTGVAASGAIGCFGSVAWWLYRSYRDDPRIRVGFADGSANQTATWIRVDEITGELEFSSARTDAGSSMFRLTPGLYRVVVEEGGRFVEVYRTVPTSDQPMIGHKRLVRGLEIKCRWLDWNEGSRGEVRVPPVSLPRASDELEMKSFPGGPISNAFPGLPTSKKTVEVAPFSLCVDVATAAEAEASLGAVFRAGERTPDQAALLPFNEAVEFAETCGLRLMTAWEWQYAATNGGRTEFPWGDSYPEADSADALAAIDAPRDGLGLRGLFSGDPEWTESVNPLRNTTRAGSLAGAPQPDRLRAVVGFARLDLPSRFQAMPPQAFRDFRRYCSENSVSDRFGVRCAKSLTVEIARNGAEHVVTPR